MRFEMFDGYEDGTKHAVNPDHVRAVTTWGDPVGKRCQLHFTDGWLLIVQGNMSEVLNKLEGPGGLR